jgi:O-succinylbenzoic acid--CoA ligase
MEQNAQRELRAANPEWTVSELMARLAKSLGSDGPALAFGPVPTDLVNEQICIVISTTGSSGSSKSVGVSSSALLASTKASNQFLGAQFGDVWSLLLPLTHIAGINVLVRALELGTEPIDLRNDHDHWKAWAKFDKRLGATARIEWNGGNFYKYTTTLSGKRYTYKRGQ